VLGWSGSWHGIGTWCGSGQNVGGRQLEWDVPKASAGITLASEDDLETVKNLHLVLGESSLKVVVAKLADQHQSTVVKIRKNVGLSSCNGKMGHVEQSGVCGSDDGAIGSLTWMPLLVGQKLTQWLSIFRK
jgi:hypothetical protein